jgi:hypothetical protein
MDEAADQKWYCEQAKGHSSIPARVKHRAAATKWLVGLAGLECGSRSSYRFRMPLASLEHHSRTV